MDLAQNPKCDFCCLVEPTKQLRCADGPIIALIDKKSGKRLTPDWQSIGDWASCDECYTLMQNKDRIALVKRSADAFRNNRGNTSRVPFSIVLVSVRTAQESFWNTWDGTTNDLNTGTNESK